LYIPDFILKLYVFLIGVISLAMDKMAPI
jgi:hypothetical protein